ncbi:hypothetical protein ANT2_4577 [plant metagenome]|uniref:Uncharacterized protein n=1 Tax=plant metagenome TaxID=1297885 RepID=A0A484RAS4_9ZZZZ
MEFAPDKDFFRMHANMPSESHARRHTVAARANALATLLVIWYSTPEENRGTVLSEYHLLGLMELLQQMTQQLVAEVLRQA